MRAEIDDALAFGTALGTTLTMGWTLVWAIVEADRAGWLAPIQAWWGGL